MAASKGFEAQSEALDALRHLTPEAAEPGLRKALGQRNNFLVAKAARLTALQNLRSLSGALAEAFHRFLQDAAKSDPQCWAKNDIAKTLAEFEFQDAELFLAGMRHIQLEPTWGGPSDTAGALRGTCALALVQCREVRSHQLLLWFTELIADKVLTVRVNAARAIEQVGSDSAALLLRLRAELASDEPELLGACYSGVLRLEGPQAIPWAARFLALGDDASAEAAIAIAETRTPEAFAILRATFDKTARTNQWFRSALLSAIALTRQPEAAPFLLDLIDRSPHDRQDAVEALCRSNPNRETVEELTKRGHRCP
ncbi:hypothetical protein SAMN05421770_102490 [Granulicella rosea]|uniref:HEAT repeat-containing protein n=1 Tax=Granulicella rosea TaxID=474952 RepID=A0A239HPQ8_9BACT|nr:hypothetical protein [Granulicella rosea]SNS83088.1 hypothetical protein SAMN05421770_102490 [Granulicella rosea]